MKRSMPRSCEFSIYKGFFQSLMRERAERLSLAVVCSICQLKPFVPDRSPTDATTASALAFTLWELAKGPETQRRVREEILAARREVLKSAGTDEIPFSHYEKMPLLVALTKVYPDLIVNLFENEFTFFYKGGTKDTPGLVHGR
jgi:hypothetical protein